MPSSVRRSALEYFPDCFASDPLSSQIKQFSSFMNDSPTSTTVEHQRLSENESRQKNWKRWGPYLSERQWGTVREDYSAGGDAWDDFTHDQSRSRAYRWGEDGLLGFSDRQCRLCFALALWNGNDSILKERLYGLTGPQGNHGEDVKEVYYYLDSTPTHSYCKASYRYPQAAYPYELLQTQNAGRTLDEGEYELHHTGVFDDDRFFDVQAEYAKAGPDDIMVRITITNHGPEAHPIWVLPTLWFRNTWVWGCRHEGCSLKPRIEKVDGNAVRTQHEFLQPFRCEFGDHPDGNQVPLLFTDNETNQELLFGEENFTPYVKDAFHRYVIDGQTDAVQPRHYGTKVAGMYAMTIPAGQSKQFTVRLYDPDAAGADSVSVPETFDRRIDEANAFYDAVLPDGLEDDERSVCRQAYAGLLWSKQFYHYIVNDWLKGDRDVAVPPAQRLSGRNSRWRHLYARDILSMPDKWEYPWFAAWDLAFHMIPMARIDPEFAKRQLTVMLREWYMHPNGQIPAYEYYFDDVNPPVHAWACLRVYQETVRQGCPDRTFLATSFQRLLMNFTWWVNQVDDNGDNVFAGGFLGLDNIGVFDRSKGLPHGTQLEQADGTAWMAFYCGTMLSISLELARDDDSYAELASKFLDHFIRIIDAINTIDGDGLWDEEDQFYYDSLHVDGRQVALKVRSLVGLIPLIAVQIIDQGLVEQLPVFKDKLDWFLKYRHHLAKNIHWASEGCSGESMLLSIASKERLQAVVDVMMKETEFLSDFGIRSLSRCHAQRPFELELRGETHRVAYVPGESDSWMFGGNSNWRGPVWLPVNYLLIEALRRYHQFYGDQIQIDAPDGSGTKMNLCQAADEINRRLTRLVLRPGDGAVRPSMAGNVPSGENPLWNDTLLFYEYFHGDTGQGLGASHQTGWTSLVATCLERAAVAPKT
ncbi:Mannosyl oligosaccharide glucosidase [Crateriforma conspicua]|uniref:Mannosyl oligosaccharide glucosidase n=2 Tax=Planctomycetaceae TaxID=126 RepID=A0A5C6FNV7_9PLAN|nr:Mannosyl oligosaccharide glucosidase [Crateriforma conspicua]